MLRFCPFRCQFGIPGAVLLGLGHKISQFYQVETSGGQAEVESDLLQPDMPELAKPGYDLGPAEELFDLLSVLQALLVGCVSGGAAIDRRTRLLAGDMRSNIEFPHVLNEVGAVISFVGCHGDSLCPVPLLALHE